MRSHVLNTLNFVQDWPCSPEKDKRKKKPPQKKAHLFDHAEELLYQGLLNVCRIRVAHAHEAVSRVDPLHPRLGQGQRGSGHVAPTHVKAGLYSKQEGDGKVSVDGFYSVVVPEILFSLAIKFDNNRSTPLQIKRYKYNLTTVQV